jgi:DEAD/DEAH box helicase domain-containing protein
MADVNTLDRLRFDPQFMANVAAWERLPAREARHGPFPSTLHNSLISNLQSWGIERLYIHQTQAVSAALRGENVVVVTGTASGKTLCYNLPVLHTLLSDPDARALYLFPTKALAQDQADELTQFVSALESHLVTPSPRHPGSIAIRTYDGDTPQAQRGSIRKSARVLISNPDMLHTGILPHHTKWESLFSNLRYVVLDELHTYRGVFGSHMANVIRRLKRICAFYGSAPQFICASATISNPQSLAEKLIEAPITLVDEDGSPRAEKIVVLYNPPVIDPALGQRRSYLLETQRLAGEFLADDIQTVMFARTRNAVEVLLGYVRDEAERRGRDPQSVRGYRGGYLPLERREIERGLRDGSVRAVVATNALELGVDIGQLEAAVIAGYPGTIASLWQQAGRAGRRSETSAVLMVASAAPLDQYLVTHPRYVFERSPENALINPDNLALLADHLRCAVFELPFKTGESFGAFKDVDELLEALAEEGELHRSNGTYRWIADTYPADSISLRSATGDRIVIQDVSAGRPAVVGEVDRATAPVRVHEGAVYLHEGKQFLVTKLDWEQGLAEVQAAEVDYFTEASEAVDIEIVSVFDATEGGPAVETLSVTRHSSPVTPHAWGELLVTSQPASYRKVKRYTHETLGYGEIHLPAREFQTTGYWLWIPPEMVRRLAEEGILIAPNDYGPNWEQQRRAARARDGYRCRQCGAPEPTPSQTLPHFAQQNGGGQGGGRQHDVHHLTPFRSFGYVPGLNENYRLANELDNLITLCRACHSRAEASRGTQTALGGLAHALGNIAPLFLMCDPRDINVLGEPRSKETGAPTITIYDSAPDGLGFAERLYELHDELLRGALDLVCACPCREGCPACVGPVGLEGAETKELTRRLAARLAGSVR